MDIERELNPDFVESVKAAEASGYKEYKTGEEMLKDFLKNNKLAALSLEKA